MYIKMTNNANAFLLLKIYLRYVCSKMMQARGNLSQFCYNSKKKNQNNATYGGLVKMWYIYTVKYYTVVKKEEFL